MPRSSRPRSLLAAPLMALGALLALSACAPGGVLADSGAADLTLDTGEGAPLRLIHAPGESEVRLTPPVDGEVQLLFSYNDPFVDVTLRTNANEVSEGDAVALPSDALTLEVFLDDVSYGAGAGASGVVELQVLEVDDELGSAHVSALLDATLRSADGAELLVEGFLEATIGD